ncbi:MAG TPA: ABATE domain-containing protein [Aggregatilineales bacterium]|nr:ABATE domain-containing protein [Aggregatilineales bacterium]
MIENEITYEFIADRLCLDFCNTGEDRTENYVGELLGSYSGLLNWSVQAGLLTGSQASRLDALAAANPAAANRVYQRAVTLREALYRQFSALAGSRDLASEDLKILNDVLAQALGHRQVQRTESGFAWAWQRPGDDLDQMLWPVALSAAELLTSPEVSRVHECGNGNCSWLFLDLSRNHSRRWCKMESCGNRVKARRFRRREK